VQRALAPLGAEGGGCGTHWRGEARETSTRWRSRPPASRWPSRRRPGPTTRATSPGCASRQRGCHGVGGDGLATARSLSCAWCDCVGWSASSTTSSSSPSTVWSPSSASRQDAFRYTTRLTSARRHRDLPHDGVRPMRVNVGTHLLARMLTTGSVRCRPRWRGSAHSVRRGWRGARRGRSIILTSALCRPGARGMRCEAGCRFWVRIIRATSVEATRHTVCGNLAVSG
jgi:hypothetical protein